MKQGELCRRDNDCETGLMCQQIPGRDARSCQPPTTSNKLYSELKSFIFGKGGKFGKCQYKLCIHYRWGVHHVEWMWHQSRIVLSAAKTTSANTQKGNDPSFMKFVTISEDIETSKPLNIKIQENPRMKTRSLLSDIAPYNNTIFKRKVNHSLSDLNLLSFQEVQSLCQFLKSPAW